MGRHEDRLAAALDVIAPGIRVRDEVVMPRNARKIDMTLFSERPHSLWGALAERLKDRTVLLEAYSDRPRLQSLLRSVTKLAWLSEQWQAEREGIRGRNAPLLVVLGWGAPRTALRRLGWCETRDTTGLFERAAVEFHGAIYMNVATIGQNTGMSQLEHLYFPRGSTSRSERMHRLLGDPAVPTIQKSRIVEAYMKGAIPADAEEKQSAYEAAVAEGIERGLEQGIQEGIEQGILRLLATVCTESELEELRQIDSADVLLARAAALLRARTAAEPGHDG